MERKNSTRGDCDIEARKCLRKREIITRRDGIALGGKNSENCNDEARKWSDKGELQYGRDGIDRNKGD